MTAQPATGSYYTRVGDHRYKPTAHASGAWDPDEQHFSPLGGLVAHTLDRHLAARPDEGGLLLSRISYDILGRLALDECEIRVETVRPGRTIAWVSTPLSLVAGEPSSPLASYLALVDTANGIAVRQPPTAWMFPNVDLTVHLHRQPVGDWTGLDTTVTFGPTGQGLTSTVLYDVTGPVGHAQQILTVRPQPGQDTIGAR